MLDHVFKDNTLILQRKYAVLRYSRQFTFSLFVTIIKQFNKLIEVKGRPEWIEASQKNVVFSHIPSACRWETFRHECSTK